MQTRNGENVRYPSVAESRKSVGGNRLRIARKHSETHTRGVGSKVVEQRPLHCLGNGSEQRKAVLRSKTLAHRTAIFYAPYGVVIYFAESKKILLFEIGVECCKIAAPAVSER